ncbi:hypothetical protein DICPUDRAFT_158968 [Dictyostelium purpureum]|uniref:Uncharacterized protein n=1 Tax=Dictyostelium purpureum TaxID=5786 RepID=F1A2Y0_DICPU|nr:uncharacterized protein DICPUDRAFT_158968 [Dictyostelium purpureum]EGC29446.1 hypothetical protein DICPUDRAFT_158968 [Dictyostelium purpureum]|eukprot:XP_003294024.1 hypothetical protein DICPUDRAFT_158968 [Dictyostelium purpureum]
MAKDDKKSNSKPQISELMKKLLEPQEVVISRYRDGEGIPRIEEFKEAVRRGFFLIKFPNTFGGSEIGVSLKGLPKEYTLNNLTSEWSPDGSTVKILGKVEFQSIPTRFRAQFRLSSLEGVGNLELL